MSNFDLFNSECGLSHAAQQWNKMWDLWVEGKIPSPYTELMRYQSEVYNGGHSQYFCNIDNCYDLQAEVEAIMTILPPALAEHVHRFHVAFIAAGNDLNDETNDIEEACENAFYEHDKQINKLLEDYAATIEL